MKLKRWIARIVIALIPVTLIGIAIAYAATPAYFTLSPSSGTYYTSCNQSVSVDIMIHTNNTATNSSNIIIDYDDSLASITDDNGGLSGIQITPGSAYDGYSSYTVNEVTDKILMTGYNTVSPYNSGNSEAVFGTFTTSPIGAGTADFDIDFTLASTIDSNIAEDGTSADILADVENASFTFLADSLVPYLSNISPVADATGVSISQNISFRIKDDECGVDLDNLTVTVEGVDYTKSGGNTFSYSGTVNNYLITVNPASNFAYNEVINVTIAGEDAVTNAVNSSYSYTTIVDDTPPSVSSKNPAASATGVLPTSNVVFHVTDTQSGVDIDTVSTTVGGITYTKSGDNTFGYSGSGSDYTITVNPSSDFSRGSTISVAIDADDLEGNTMSTVNYTFDIETDTSGPVISNRVPDDSATDVAKTSNVTFTISDSPAGVDLSTLSVVVKGVTYTQSGDNQFSASGSASSYNITINPDSDFTRGDVIAVTIDASDLDGTAMTQDAYSFTVIANSTPTITLIPDKTVTAGNLLTFLVEASDSDGDTVTIAMTSDDLPAGATYTVISDTQGIFTWTPTEDDVASYTADFTATDDGPGSSSYVESVGITVQTGGVGGNNTPIITALSDQSVYIGSSLSLVIHSTDADGDTLTVTSTTTEQSALTLTPISNGISSLLINTTTLGLGTHVITVTSTDDGAPNLNDQETFTVTVLDYPSTASTTATAPAITAIGDQSVYAGSDLVLIVHAIDVNEDTISFGVNNGGVTLASISNGLATLTIDSDNLNVGANTITVTATDDSVSTLSSTESFVVTVTALPVCAVCETCQACTSTSTSSSSSSATYGGGGDGTPDDDEEEEEEVIEEEEEVVEEEEETYSAVEEEDTETAKDEAEIVYIETACDESSDVIEKTVYIETEAGTCEPIITEPTTIFFYPNRGDIRYAVDEPIVITFADVDEIQLDTVTLVVNNNEVDYEIHENNELGFPIYSMVHHPSEMYTPGELISVRVEFLDSEDEQMRIWNSFWVESVETIIEEAEEAEEDDPFIVQYRELFIGAEEDGQIYIEGDIFGEDVEEVEVTWFGRYEDVKVTKRVKNGHFKIEAPMEFSDGEYYVEIVGLRKSGLERSASVRVYFKVTSAEGAGSVSYEVLAEDVEQVTYQGFFEINELAGKIWWLIFIIIGFLLGTIVWHRKNPEEDEEEDELSEEEKNKKNTKK